MVFMQHISNNESKILRQFVNCLAGFFVLLVLFLMSGIFSPDTTACHRCQEVNHSHLAAFPSGDTEDDAAVRWDFRCRTSTAMRIDNRNQLRVTVPAVDNAAEAVREASGTTCIQNKAIWSRQPLLTYYRRLWQKVLPSRAGPLA